MSLSACCCSFLLKGWASTRLNQVPPGSFAREASIRAQRPGAFKRPSRTLFLKKIACPSASSWGNHCLALPSIAFQCLEQHPCHTGFARPDTLRMSARRGRTVALAARRMSGFLPLSLPRSKRIFDQRKIPTTPSKGSGELHRQGHLPRAGCMCLCASGWLLSYKELSLARWRPSEDPSMGERLSGGFPLPLRELTVWLRTSIFTDPLASDLVVSWACSLHPAW